MKSFTDALTEVVMHSEDLDSFLKDTGIAARDFADTAKTIAQGIKTDALVSDDSLALSAGVGVSFMLGFKVALAMNEQ